MALKLVVLCLVLIEFAIGDVIVQTYDGKIRGISQQTRNGITYNSFLGVRYGKNPINELRFQPPIPVDPWDDVFDATTEKGICYQVTLDSDLETEDCLLLNLYTPMDLSSNSSASLPVMFFIHGGGFVEGSGILEWGVGPQFLVEYGVIMVAINYRLGPFGFLSTGDSVIPGNVGMKDQLMALQWVQRNIKYFGGDPEKVTIFGQSAGAASVSYLLLSPLSKGLFRAAILESGSALSPWAYQRNQVEISFQTAAVLNQEFAENRNSSDLLEYLQSISGKEIDVASAELTAKIQNAGNLQISKGFFYTPVIEQQSDDAFLTNLQYESFANGLFNNVPVLIGFNAEESLFMISDGFPAILEAYDSDTKLVVPFDMHIGDLDVKQAVGDIIKQFYIPGQNFQDSLLAGVKYHSNQDFDKSVIKQAELQAPYIPVYFYEFTYSGKMGNNPTHLDGSGAVGHGEEQNYIFGRWYSDELPDNTDLSQFPQADVNVHYRFMTLFTNFAKYLNPTPEQEEILQNIIWPTVQTENFQYLQIDTDLSVNQGYPKSKMYSLWTNLYETYGTKPFDTF
ncbi:hypothetical protein GWI33_014105 [Rhynchophorus ferrugineus]|uniref:Carboxylic ester hydrolase n=2 Tax=Rhynchophorus ferrugineus TaxID=354439 RepID=A0A834I5S3_RHYFE|nr:hypothetical protein GWI33_014105 [Rhynchophorus ferrugineus]